MTLLVDPSNPAVAETTTNQVRIGARTLGLELHVLNASRAPRQFPSLTPPDRANPATGVNSGLAKTWGQDQAEKIGLNGKHATKRRSTRVVRGDACIGPRKLRFTVG